MASTELNIAEKFAGASRLTKTYEIARGKEKPSMQLMDVGGAPGIPTEAYFKDTRIGESLGAVWYSELRDLMDHADKQQDYDGGNPNYPVIETALREMVAIRQRLGQPT